MSILIQILLLLGLILGAAFWQLAPLVWAIGIGIVLGTMIYLHSLPTVLLIVVSLLWLIAVLIAMVTPLRQRLFTAPILSWLKTVLPPMSQTEREVIEAGDVWWEGDLFRGDPDWQRLLNFTPVSLTAEEQAFIDNQVEKLCAMVNDWEITQKLYDLSPETWDYLKKERFFGIVLPKEYGGLGFSPLAHSTIIAKIGTRSISAAVATMVPNSLGPGELLIHYGTEAQKQQYLPKLANGEEIPCFALTDTEAGSDATAMTDVGIICKGMHKGKEIIGMRLNWDKRYITLAPIATLLGLAFKLYDPDHLLGTQDYLGITVALIATSHPGIEVGKRHFPLNTAFLNGPTRGKDVFIPLDWIVGGKENIGRGWQMLSECLSIGRGISLPAVSTAGSMLSFRFGSAYARIRQQFNLPIGYFEGVQTALAEIGGHGYLLEALRVFSLIPVTEKLKPAITSAIAKYHMTEMGRKSFNHAMDIHGGHAIQLGPHNYLGRFYQSIPICITVEGANILTRNLIIFGQGAIRCHPYLYREMQAAQLSNKQQAIKTFDPLLLSHIAYASKNFAKTFFYGITEGHFIPKPPVAKELSYYVKQMTRMSSSLAFTSDIAMLMLGGSLKRKENLSARLGDVLSYLFMASAVVKFYQNSKEELPYVHWALSVCLYEIQHAFNDFFTNFPIRGVAWLLKIFVFPYGDSYKVPNDDLMHDIANHMLLPSALRDKLTQGCYIGKTLDDAVGRVEIAWQRLFIAKPAIDKIRKAVHEKILPNHSSLLIQAKQAHDTKIISAVEYEQIISYDEARIAAIKVDEFDFDYFIKD